MLWRFVCASPFDGDREIREIRVIDPRARLAGCPDCGAFLGGWVIGIELGFYLMRSDGFGGMMAYEMLLYEINGIFNTTSGIQIINILLITIVISYNYLYILLHKAISYE